MAIQVENVGKGVLDVKISHRFGHLNSGGYNLFGTGRCIYADGA
jgi:hypothetical protein